MKSITIKTVRHPWSLLRDCKKTLINRIDSYTLISFAMCGASGFLIGLSGPLPWVFLMIYGLYLIGGIVAITIVHQREAQNSRHKKTVVLSTEIAVWITYLAIIRWTTLLGSFLWSLA